MKKILLIASVLVLFFPNISFAYTDHLVISQIQITGGPGLTTNDFIELYNPTGSDIDLNGLRLVKRTKTGDADTLIKSWTESTIVKAHGFYLWANSNFTTISIAADVTTSASLADDNGVALRNGPNDTGAIVDSVAWGEAANIFVEASVFAANPAANESLERSADTNNNSADFTIQTSPHPRNSQSEIDPPLAEAEPAPEPEPEPEPEPDPEAPPPSPTGGGTYTPPPTVNYSAAVKISEFMPNPEGSDSGQEWVELFSAEEVDLSGWKLDDEGVNGTIGSSAYVFPAGSKILANQFLMVAIPKGKFALNNTGGDTLRLVRPDNQSAEEVAYTTAAPEGISYNRLNTGEFDWTETLVEETPTLTDEQKEQEESAVVYPDEIEINELLPYPSKGGEEFIELKNLSQEEINLKNWVISDKSSKYKITDLVLSANGYIVLNKSQTKIALNNFGEEQVFLKNPAGEVVDQFEYEDPPRNQSYNRLGNEEPLWSLAITPGKPNSVKTAIQPPPEPEEEPGEVSYTEAGEVAAASIISSPPEITIKTPRTAWFRNLLWPVLSFVWGIIICYSYFRLKKITV